MTKKTRLTPETTGGNQAASVHEADKLMIQMSDYEGKSQEWVGADVAQSPIYANAQTARVYSQGYFGLSDLTASAGVLKAKAERAKAGDLSDMEAMLVAQATASIPSLPRWPAVLP